VCKRLEKWSGPLYPLHERVYPYPLSRQKLGVFKVDSSPCVKAVGTEGARRATGVPTATPYTSAGGR